MRAGFLQFHVKLGEIEKNIKFIETATKEINFDLLVLPEATFSGYEIKDKRILSQLSETVNHSNTLDRICKLANKKNAFIVGGFFEKENNELFNSAFLAGPDGIIGIYRKTHLFMDEKKLFTPGNTGFKVFETRIGKIGIMICFDWMFPEAARTLALRGADIICHPSNLILPYCQDAMITRSLENHLFSITANRTGKDKTLNFTGKSQIVSPTGKRLASAGKTIETYKIIDINIAEARNKMITPQNHIFKDRRLEQYQENYSESK